MTENLKPKGLAILGSTGSIGCNTLRVVESLGSERFRVVALGAGKNVAVLADQVARYLPELVSVETEQAAHDLRAQLFERDVDLPRILVGEAGLVEVATHPAAACVVSATVGAVGFVPTLRALEAGKRVALANKSKSEMQESTVSEALRHPTWSMGAKITIDSATLMNKGLEVIEAHWLFGFAPDQIAIVVHPESVVHSMIELVDGSVIAQLGVTDMRHAIQYALTFPERQGSQLPPLDLTALSALHFEPPDSDRFPCIALAYRALRAGGTLPAAMNAANEVAVQAFIEERISLTDIPLVIEAVMNEHQTLPATELETILAADSSARFNAAQEIEKLSRTAPSLA
jgi:1-deoxy-D-xylulose-5-phosphate reductoisomerase